MADALSSVFRGTENSGEAFILPQNQALNVYLGGVQDQNERDRLMRAAALKRQQEIADQNATTLSKLTIPDHWQQRSSELQGDYNKLSQYALEATQSGKNINTDRNFLQMRNTLLGKAAATKELQGIYEDRFKTVGANPDKYENSIEALQNIKGASIDDYLSGKYKPDQLRQIYNLEDAMKASDATTSYVKNNDGTYDTTRVNRSGNVGQAIASLDSTEAKYILNKTGGDPSGYTKGFPTTTKDGRTYYNTSGKPFEDAVINALATDPQLPAYLQSKGYDVSSTDAIRKSALDYAKRQNESVGNYVKNYADKLENKATTDTTRLFAAEANRRANEDQAMSRERLAHDRLKWADEELAKNPDDIASNVVTNIATTQTGPGGKVVNRPSTSFAASNVGNAKTPFLPKVVYDPATGIAAANSSSINVSGGQVHIKPVLTFGGVEKVLDDESLNKLKEGTYKVNGKIVPKDANIRYDELLYGDERVPADPNDPLGKATVRKLIIPITGQSLDKKFDKGYNRPKMYDTAIRSMSDTSDRKRAALQFIRQFNEGKGFSEAQLKEKAAEYLNSIE